MNWRGNDSGNHLRGGRSASGRGPADSVEVDYRTNFNAWYHVVVNTDTRIYSMASTVLILDDLFFSKVNDLYQGVC